MRPPFLEFSLPHNMGSPHFEKCSVGCPILDQRLGGGIPCKTISEFVSESGMGKTQLCLQIALQAHMPRERGGLEGSCIYFYTDFAFPLPRLHQMANASGIRNLEAIFVQTVADANELLQQLNRTESFIENNLPILPVRVLIIDSIASLFRSQFQNTHRVMRERQSLFYRIARKLKSLARRYNIAVVTTNQVKDYFVNEGGGSNERLGYLPELWTSGRRVLPALGPSWGRCVDSRLFLSQNFQTITDSDEGTSRVISTRRLHVLFAPHVRYSSVGYVVEAEGIRGITYQC